MRSWLWRAGVENLSWGFSVPLNYWGGHVTERGRGLSYVGHVRRAHKMLARHAWGSSAGELARCAPDVCKTCMGYEHGWTGLVLTCIALNCLVWGGSLCFPTQGAKLAWFGPSTVWYALYHLVRNETTYLGWIWECKTSLIQGFSYLYMLIIRICESYRVCHILFWLILYDVEFCPQGLDPSLFPSLSWSLNCLQAFALYNLSSIFFF